MTELIEKQNRATKRLRKLYQKWFIQEPLMYAVVVYHQLVPTGEISSIRINSGKLEFNPDFIESLPDYKLNEVLMFEAYRILLKHPYQRAKANKSMSYFSSTIAINEIYEHTLNVASLIDFGIDPDGHENQSHDYYYNLIRTRGAGPEEEVDGTPKGGGLGSDQNEEDAFDSSESGGELSDGTGESAESTGSEKQEIFDETISTTGSMEFDGEPEIVSEEEQEDSHLKSSETAAENAEEWSNQEDHTTSINKRIEEAQKNDRWGSVSGEMQEAIVASLKPEMDNRTILKKFKARILGFDHNVPTTRKFNRRLGFPYFGKTTKPNSRIGFCLDVSGSISDQTLNEGFSVVKRLFSYEVGEVELIQFDVSVKRDLVCKLHRAKSRNLLMGREGTDLNDLVDYMNERKDIDNFLIFTDGYFDQNLNLPKNKNICFLMEDKESYDSFVGSKPAHDAMFVSYMKTTY